MGIDSYYKDGYIRGKWQRWLHRGKGSGTTKAKADIRPSIDMKTV